MRFALDVPLYFSHSIIFRFPATALLLLVFSLLFWAELRGETVTTLCTQKSMKRAFKMVFRKFHFTSFITPRPRAILSIQSGLCLITSYSISKKRVKSKKNIIKNAKYFPSMCSIQFCSIRYCFLYLRFMFYTVTSRAAVAVIRYRFYQIFFEFKCCGKMVGKYDNNCRPLYDVAKIKTQWTFPQTQTSSKIQITTYYNLFKLISLLYFR